MAVSVYDAKDCTVTVDGVFVTGFGEDMISGEKEEDLFDPSVGAQGDTVAAVTNNTLGTITLSVQVTSPQKGYLMGLANRRDPFPLWCINKALNERIGGTMAKLRTFPDMSRGASPEDMEFAFTVFDYVCESTE